MEDRQVAKQRHKQHRHRTGPVSACRVVQHQPLLFFLRAASGCSMATIPVTKQDNQQNKKKRLCSLKRVRGGSVNSRDIFVSRPTFDWLTDMYI